MPEDKKDTKTEEKQQDQKDQDGKSGGETPPQTFEAWLDGQSPETKALLDEHTKGLKSALETERGSRKDLEKQVRDLAGKAGKGSEAEAELTRLADAIAESDRKTDFYEVAHAAGVTNLKLAYLMAVQDEMFDRRGQVNFEELKRVAPELFGGKPASPPGNAGAGTGSASQGTAPTMNEIIRKAAGR